MGGILAIVSRDPNDQKLHFAFVVVKGENTQSWEWFLDLLIKDLGGIEHFESTYAIISYQQKVNQTIILTLFFHVFLDLSCHVYFDLSC